MRSSNRERALAEVVHEAARKGPFVCSVRGGSMAPTLTDGERVEVAPARLYWPGDVVAFLAADGRILLHRLLGYRLLGGRLAAVTRGDACLSHDAPVPVARLLGRVREHRPGLAPPAARLRAVGAWLALAVRWTLRRTGRRRPGPGRPRPTR